MLGLVSFLSDVGNKCGGLLHQHTEPEQRSWLSSTCSPSIVS